MSASDPQSEESIRALAQKSRTTELTDREQADLDRSVKQAGRFGNELKRIIAKGRS